MQQRTLRPPGPLFAPHSSVRQFRRGGVTEAEIMLLCGTPYFLPRNPPRSTASTSAFDDEALLRLETQRMRRIDVGGDPHGRSTSRAARLAPLRRPRRSMGARTAIPNPLD